MTVASRWTKVALLSLQRKATNLWRYITSGQHVHVNPRGIGRLQWGLPAKSAAVCRRTIGAAGELHRAADQTGHGDERVVERR